MKLVFSVETDDDFILNVGNSFEVNAYTVEDLKVKAIEFLLAINITWTKTWSITRNGETTVGDYSYAWFNIRDYAIDEIKDDNFYFTYGGNQEINCYLTGEK